MKIGIFNLYMALNFNTLLTRTLTAAVFVAVLISAISHSFLSFSVLFAVVALWGLLEFYKISEKLGAKPFKRVGYLAAILLLVGGFLHNAGLYDLNFAAFYAEAFVVFALIFFAALFSKNQHPITDAAFTITGIVYAVLPFVILNYISCIDKTIMNEAPFDFNSSYNHHLILGLFFLIWANDTYAYLVGSMIGKRKLFERISPGKTWEGTIGAGILTAASAFLIGTWFPELATSHWLVIAIIVVLAGTLGDLVESLLKRQAGIKDSGRIMPGHGGILDRFDSLMFIAPFVYLYLSLIFS